MFLDIFKFLGSLPELLQLIKSVAAWLRRVSGDDIQGFIVKSGAAFDLLANAKTDEDHADAAKALAELIRNLPRS